ncbi:ATP-binding protein, partial [Kitasatospora sp. NPDC001574]
MPRILTAPTPGTPRPATEPRSRRCELADDDLAPGRLRRWVTALLADWHLSHLAGDLALVATELATNAVRHGGPRARATLSGRGTGTGPRVVRLEVEDDGPGFDPP